MRSLKLNTPQVSDLTPLAGLKNLEWLYIGSTQVSDEQVKSLRQALPNCAILQPDIEHFWFR